MFREDTCYFRSGTVYCEAICRKPGRYDFTTTDHYATVGGYCIDAPSQIPTGSVRKLQINDDEYMHPAFVYRYGDL